MNNVFNIINFPLSLNTLLFASIIPFIPFFIEQRYWYRPDKVKLYNFIITALGVILIGILVVKAGPGRAKPSEESNLFIVLHILPMLYTIISLHMKPRFFPAQQQATQTGNINEKKPIQFLPSNKQIEKLSWDDLVIDDKLRQDLISIVKLLKEPEVAYKYGIDVPKGILLAGPPGTGKTTVAKVIASTANLAFFAVSADEIISKWVGESEKNLSALFEAANRYSPAVIFIDEVDAIGKVRTGEQVWQENLLNHLLQLVDGVVKREGLYIIAATNRPDLVDAALKRAGRLNRVIEVPLPDHPSRIKLFSLYLDKLNLEEQLNLDLLAQLTEGKSGADIKGICNQAGLNAFARESNMAKRDFKVNQEDMKKALEIFLT